MAPSSRDRISVDLRGLKAALVDRAADAGQSPSDLVRATLAAAIGAPSSPEAVRPVARPVRSNGGRVRLHLRMSREYADAALRGARRAGLSLSDYIAALVADVPVVASGGRCADASTALTASTAELAALSRDLSRLTALLRQADVEAAKRYRQMLESLEAEVRKHLRSAAGLLADLRPRDRNAK